MAIPKDTVIPTAASQFARLQEGENRFRFLSDVVVGWEGWKDKKPFRQKGSVCSIKPEDVDTNPKSGKPNINYFWAMVVWNYNEKRIQVLELIQKTVMGPLYDLEQNADWGDLKNYDVVIKKSGTGTDTTYGVIAIPPKPLGVEIAQAYKDNQDKINLESLFDGKYPIAEEDPEAITAF